MDIKAKKILILYATAGIGHKKAAMAIKEAFDGLKLPAVDVTLADALDHSPAFFKKTYPQAYLLMVNKLSPLWALSYYFTDNRFVNIVISKIRHLNNWLNSRKLREYLRSTQPDVIVSTHFFASEVISSLKGKGLLRSKLVTVVTDYRLHSWWVNRNTDLYTVGSTDARDDLVKWGVPTERVRVLGIPAQPVFSGTVDKEKVVQGLGFEKGVFTILSMGGGFGVGPIEELIRAADRVRAKVQMIVVCGHNEKLIERVKALKSQLKIRIFTLGFIHNVYDYMAVSDIVISKSGGITTSESLVKELPMIIIAPIPGQETRNSDFLIRHGAALKMDNAAELKGIVEDLIGHPEKIKAMKDGIADIRRPDAPFDIAKAAVDLAHS
ncbi:MAG: hypothetical protein JW919_06450 [Candidatus Omnitrophica bacterium]|nr:hypothetical protein [Candidatus Omnitrophota bacterium]